MSLVCELVFRICSKDCVGAICRMKSRSACLADSMAAAWKRSSFLSFGVTTERFVMRGMSVVTPSCESWLIMSSACGPLGIAVAMVRRVFGGLVWFISWRVRVADFGVGVERIAVAVVPWPLKTVSC